jgi:hypothetical protein
MATVNVPPTVAALAVNVPENPNTPALEAVHTLKWVYVSVAATEVHVNVLLCEDAAFDEARHVA